MPKQKITLSPILKEKMRARPKIRSYIQQPLPKRRNSAYIQQPLVEDAVKPAVHVNELLVAVTRFNATCMDAVRGGELKQIKLAIAGLKAWCEEKGLNVSFDLVG